MEQQKQATRLPAAIFFAIGIVETAQDDLGSFSAIERRIFSEQLAQIGDAQLLREGIVSLIQYATKIEPTRPKWHEALVELIRLACHRLERLKEGAKTEAETDIPEDWYVQMMAGMTAARVNQDHQYNQ